MSKSKVAVLRVHPERVLEDVDRLLGLADVEKAPETGRWRSPKHRDRRRRRAPPGLLPAARCCQPAIQGLSVPTRFPGNDLTSSRFRMRLGVGP
jgi:hypothetical protein